MKLKHKLPLVSMVILIITFASLWIGTQKNALNFIIDYQHKISVANIEKRTQEIEQNIKDGKHILRIICQKLDKEDLNWESISSHLHKELEDSVFEKMGLVYADKTYNVTGTDKVGDLSDREYIKEVFERKVIVVSDPVYSKSNEAHQIVIAKPIIDNDEVKRVLIGTILIEDIAKHIHKLNIDGNGFGFLVNRHGDIVLQPEHANISCDNFFEHMGPVTFPGKNGYITYDGCKNTKKYAFFKKLDETGLIAVISVDQKDLHKPITNIFNKNIKIFALVLILVLFLVNFFIKRALNPINKLISGMKRVEDGDYTLQIPIDKKDEIGDIAIQFNKTIEAVSLRDEELQALNEELASSFEEINETSDKLLIAYNEIAKRLQNEELINSLSEIFYSKKDLYEVLESILVHTEEIINSERCAIYFYKEDHGCFNVIESINFSELDKCIGFKRDEGSIGWIVENKKEILITDALNDPHFVHKYSWSADISMLLHIPIFDEDGEVIGIISYFGNDLNLNFTPYLKQLSKTVSVTIQNSNLITEIKKTYFSIIMALVKSIELKDSYTSGHSQRVMEYSLMLGKKLNLSTKELEILRYGSILHDIGKLAIPDDVLLKPGKLTDLEYDLIKSHSERGEEFIGDLEFLKNTLSIIRNHHERIDGKGYPDGLKGDEIEQLTKIVTIADAYDAMTSKRAYKDTLSKKDAIKELIKHKGSQFDPYLVEKFIEVIL